ncbi:hypothetical protein Pan54_25520 [Rubinisphaera italica]|uniref:Uncharacterized protein n=2 Tax=Rubinisphaera italica TaxID=2527969 RepID=A0A5C5XI32_9PLAN|nr:hypothetical protein Pan54_25520 [Rubinisphaera italica]
MSLELKMKTTIKQRIPKLLPGRNSSAVAGVDYGQNSSQQQSQRRGGAAIIIVLAMTGMLAFLGFFFFSFISSERNSAGWFAATPNREISEGDYFDFALQQIIIGPSDEYKNSALSGGKWSMLPNMVGSFGPDLKPDDLHLFSGRGITVTYQKDPNTDLPNDTTNSNNNFGFDYNSDGVIDGKVVNFSPAANPVGGNNYPASPLGQSNHPNYVPDFEPDAGYTYPDINSMFLGYFAFVDVDPSTSVNLRRVWVPSFHRPQYLPRNEDVDGVPMTDIYTDSTYANRVLRPHKSHLVQLKQFSGSTLNQQSAPRFISSGSFHSYTGAAGPANPFPFPDFGANEYQAGIWTHGRAGHNLITYDVDADGILANGDEAILTDLDHAVEILSDGTKRIPIFAITILDADGLMNLNTGGNLYGEATKLQHVRTEPSSAGDDPLGDNHFISNSNLGLSPSEINLARGFYRPLPDLGGATTEPPASMPLYADMFEISATGGGTVQVTQLDMANMELTRLLIGVADGDLGTTDDLVWGRWGEADGLAGSANEDRLELGVAAATTLNPASPLAPTPPVPRTTWGSPRLPGAGATAQDDDEDYLTGGGKVRFANSSYRDPVFGTLGLTIPPVVHPIDEIAVGIDYVSGTNLSISSNTRDANNSFVLNNTIYTNITGGSPVEYGKFRASAKPEANNPSRWSSYSKRWERQLVAGSLSGTTEANQLDDLKLKTGVLPYTEAEKSDGSRALLQPRTSNSADNLFLADEPDEIIVEPSFRNPDDDALLSVGEMQFLHMNDTDWGIAASTASSRLEKLVKFNFERTDFLSTTTNDIEDSWWLRSQFTTDSWDRWEFAFSPAVGAIMDINDPNYDITQNRAWEFSPVNNDNTRLAFPPEFGNATRFSANDPFRDELRQWISIELERDQVFANFPLPQRRLIINRLLDKDRDGDFRYRHLTPHPVFGTGDPDPKGLMDLMYDPSNSVVKSYDPGSEPVAFESIANDKFAQEWWAKYDRQRLARDIYVLLYTLGAGDDTIDVTQDPDAYDPSVLDEDAVDSSGSRVGNDVNDHLQAMAQFAVNYVDALDRDNVITEFVFDTDLSDGWDITGEKDANGQLTELPEAARVFGVESQQLTFSETYFVQIERGEMNDSPKTPWVDTAGTPLQFLIMELRNASPFLVDYKTDSWRIRRIVGEDDFRVNTNGNSGDDETDDEWVEFKTVGAIPGIPAGANFWIGAHDEADTSLPAAVMLDEDDNGTIERDEVLCPSREQETDGDTKPVCHLDINHDDHASFRTNKGGSPNFLMGEIRDKFEIVLERRCHIQGDGEYSSEVSNPWVPVDYMFVQRDGTVQPLDQSSPPASRTIDLSDFDNQKSIERPQPLHRLPRVDGYASIPGNRENNEGSGPRRHSIGPQTPLSYDNQDISNYPSAPYVPYVAENSNCPTVNSVKTYTLWQPHFDRDFTSVYELMSVPIVGPGQLTESITDGANGMSGLHTAFTKFAVTDPGTPADTSDDNRWYRLLEFLEVPDGSQKAIRDNLPMPRSPGKINLNTIRHPSVFAGLVDDDYHLDTFPTPAQIIAFNDDAKQLFPYAVAQDPNEAARNWYSQYIYSRDRIDPYTDAPLPGIPGSRPFRPMGYLPESNLGANYDKVSPVEHTFLRSLPLTDDGGLSSTGPSFTGVGPMSENNNRIGVNGLWDDMLDNGTGMLESEENRKKYAIGRRRLFEARTNNDANFPSITDVNAVDFHTRNRLLNKIANNATVRSNVYYCWIHVQFHEAAEDEFGNVQVGGELSGGENASQRAFFVIDRSKLEEAWDPRSQSFDWRKFVLLRKVLN